MAHDYDITIIIDGRPRSGKWTLQQGGRVRVTCIWGAHTVDCVPPVRPELAAGEALEQIFRAFHREQVELAERTARELAVVERYWDEQQAARDEKAPPLRRASRAKVRREGEEGLGVGLPDPGDV